MSIAPTAPSDPSTLPPPEATTPGNYFIANYPPFAFWKPDFVPELHAALAQTPVADGPEGVPPLGLYVHIPFCRKRCHFCYFKVYTDKRSDEVRAYLDALLTELSAYVQQPALSGRKPRFVYFGGGTPSYLSVEQLRHLIGGLKSRLPWDQVEEATFEAEPGTLTEAKLHAIRELGITRLSLGIEHFDDHVLEINGRAHRSAEILRAYRWARQAGFPQINIDLIAGMVEETEERWCETVARAAALRPDSVTVYQMEVPYNTTLYQRMKAEGRLVAPVADWATKRRWVDHAFAQFERLGYTVTSSTTVVHDPARVKFLYRDGLFSGADILAIGVASFGHLNGVHYQNHHDFQPYIEAVRAGRLPLYRAYRPSAEERYIREFILQLKLGGVEPSRFIRKFGTDPRVQFAAPLASLRSRGWLLERDDRIGVTREALLQIDRLLLEFFKPEHRTGRYA